MLVELIDDGLWWNTNGGDKESCATFDDDVDEISKLALGVVV